MYSKVTTVDGWRYCLMCFSSGKSFYRIRHMHINLSFHPAGKLLKAEGKQLKMAPGSSWNQADSLGPSLPRVNNKDSWEPFSDNLSCKDCETRPPAWIKQKSAELHGRGLDQLRYLEGTRFNLLSCLQAVPCPPGSQILWVSTITGVVFVDVAVFESCLLLWLTPHPYFHKQTQ